jgi:hypothetical protein
MDLLEKFAPKKKNLGINQCGEKGGWGGGVLNNSQTYGFEKFRIKEPSVLGI